MDALILGTRRLSARPFAWVPAILAVSFATSAQAQDATPTTSVGGARANAPAAAAPAAPPPGDAKSAPPLGVGVLPEPRTGKRLAWDPDQRRFETGDWVLTGVDGALTLTFAIVKPFPAAFHGGILFDDSVRSALRPSDIDLRGVARDTSDVLLSLEIMTPFLIDSMTTAWWYRGSADVAQQMALIDLETISVTAAVQGAFTVFTGRERPYGQTCGTPELPSDSLDCQTFGRFRSYFSGHTSLSFTSAALVCQHHLGMHLFDDGPADAFACISSMMAAGATGALRIVSDQHYATDVFTGAVMGTAIGFAVPYLLHYGRRSHPSGTASNESDFTFHVVPTGLGASAVGTF